MRRRPQLHPASVALGLRGRAGIGLAMRDVLLRYFKGRRVEVVGRSGTRYQGVLAGADRDFIRLDEARILQRGAIVEVRGPLCVNRREAVWVYGAQ